jgi:hypothetical protein
MPGLTSGAAYYRSPRFYQRGHGLGSILSGVWRFVKPLFFPSIKRLASGALKQAGRSGALKGVARKMKKRAVKAGLNAVTNALTGKNVSAGLKKDASAAGHDLAQLTDELARGVANEAARRKRKAPAGRSLTVAPQKKKPRRGTKNLFDEF